MTGLTSAVDFHALQGGEQLKGFDIGDGPGAQPVVGIATQCRAQEFFFRPDATDETVTEDGTELSHARI